MDNHGKDQGKSFNHGLLNQVNNPGEDLLRIKEVAALLGENKTTLENWMKQLRQFVPTKREESSGYHLFGESAIKVLQTIQTMHRKQGYSMKQIAHYLNTGEGRELPPEDVMVTDGIYKQLDELREMIQQTAATQQEFNRALVERLDAQQRYIEDSINRRDQQLMIALSEIKERKKLNFWRRLFK